MLLISCQSPLKLSYGTRGKQQILSKGPCGCSTTVKSNVKGVVVRKSNKVVALVVVPVAQSTRRLQQQTQCSSRRVKSHCRCPTRFYDRKSSAPQTLMMNIETVSETHLNSSSKRAARWTLLTWLSCPPYHHQTVRERPITRLGGPDRVVGAVAPAAPVAYHVTTRLARFFGSHLFFPPQPSSSNTHRALRASLWAPIIFALYNMYRTRLRPSHIVHVMTLTWLLTRMASHPQILLLWVPLCPVWAGPHPLIIWTHFFPAIRMGTRSLPQMSYPTLQVRPIHVFYDEFSYKVTGF